ncbi:hypothetical protein DMH08_16730 [Actinomadura sp. WAC 06369]|nr:hypothetical protein DMH08_16730 [Actinomadura sp. WAC 06369]
MRTFGEISGHPEGTPYVSRDAARRAGLHAHNQAGISGTAREGADAIVLNGGYSDDRDYGDVIVYTGHGGQNAQKQQIADQSLEDSGNAALVKSQLDGLPVRVIRGYEEPSPHAPERGYRYDGLYRVVRHWFKTRDDGFRVCQFLMTKLDAPFDFFSADIPLEDADDAAPAGPVERRLATIQRMRRNVEVVRKVKGWHGNRCQVCRQTVDLPSGPSSQVAHIRGLGVPHNGPDVVENALCLCPNDHLRFDNGAIYLTDDLRIVDALTTNIGEQIHVHPAHRIAIEHVRYHRSCWVTRETGQGAT